MRPRVRGWLVPFERALGEAEVLAFEAELKRGLGKELFVLLLEAHIGRRLVSQDLHIRERLLEACQRAGVAAGLEAGLEAGLVAGLGRWIDYSDRDVGLNWGLHVGAETSRHVGRKAAIQALEDQPEPQT